MRMDGGRKFRTLFAVKPKARTVRGREVKGLLSDPRSKLRLRREKEKYI